MIAARKIETLPCVVDIEQTADSLHAHVVIEGMQPGPGDTVIVHGAPTSIAFGERGTFHCRATIYRAGPIARQVTRAMSYLELTELYEIGFSAGSAS